MNAARAPRAAPREDSLTVDRNSAIAPTPSIETATYPIAANIRVESSVEVSVTPDTVVTAVGSAGNSDTPTTNAVAATASTATTTYTTSATSLATSSRVRPTGRSSRYRSV